MPEISLALPSGEDVVEELTVDSLEQTPKPATETPEAEEEPTGEEDKQKEFKETGNNTDVPEEKVSSFIYVTALYDSMKLM